MYRRMDIHLLVAIVIIMATKTESARILIVNAIPSISHQVVFRPIIEELIKQGHEVVIITTDPVFPRGQAPGSNLTEIDMHNVSYTIWQKYLSIADVGKRCDLSKQVKIFSKLFGVIFGHQLKTEPLQNLIRNKNNMSFDLLLLEPSVRSTFVFSHIFQAPVISVTPYGPIYRTYAHKGAPSHPLLYPILGHKRLYNLSYWEKLKEIYYHYIFEDIFFSFENEEMEMLEKYCGPNIPSITKLSNNEEMFLQNVHSIFMDNPPSPLNMIYLGGLHQKLQNPLPEELMKYLNSSRNGVVYVSFGTNVKTSLLPTEKIQMMTRVFSTLPYDVLWKMDTEKLPGQTDNIKVTKWLPQADLLRHQNIKAFVTQGGQQSTDEAIAGGVPLIGIPIFGDQFFNVEKYVHHMIGVKLDWDSLEEEEFREAILTVIKDTRYRNNIRKFRSIINDQPQTPLQRAMWWIEYTLRHGGTRHLRAPAFNMSFMEYYEIDLIIIVMTILAVIIFTLSAVLYFIWIRLCMFHKAVKEKH